MNVTEINTDSREGKLLLMAVAKLSTELHLDFTPDQILELLEEMSKYCLEEINYVEDENRRLIYSENI